MGREWKQRVQQGEAKKGGVVEARIWECDRTSKRETSGNSRSMYLMILGSSIWAYAYHIAVRSSESPAVLNAMPMDKTVPLVVTAIVQRGKRCGSRYETLS